MQRSFPQHEIPKDYLPTSFIAIDTEGQPPVEIAALAVKENHIIGVYHDFIYQSYKDTADDYYARAHIHGVPRELSATRDGRWYDRWAAWRNYHNGLPLIANDGHHERHLLGEDIMNHRLSPWAHREFTNGHIVAKFMKEQDKKITLVSCKKSVNHRMYQGHDLCKNKVKPADFVKINYGHHCALYDCIELSIDIVSKTYQKVYLKPITAVFKDSAVDLYHIDDVFDESRCTQLKV